MPGATTNNRVHFVHFETAIGRCALLWRGGLVIGAALPEADEASLRSSLAARFPGAEEAEPPGFVAEAAALIVRLLAGEKVDFASIPVDLGSASDLERKVYEAARRIPCGEVRTYGEIANEIGAPGAAQAVGAALGRNPVPILVPCHRILASGGRSGGFSAPGGVATKFRMLEIERARRSGDSGLFEDLPLAVKPAR
ncbi:MAG TPA: methylated-DNA--[protein]-cysteine S-methyltransferase [Allosphingosinicella sp.]|nr:methylated-DNA--[protein]-cysteine S-methyltransferase [Allosphingosinicella sp.]